MLQAVKILIVFIFFCSQFVAAQTLRKTIEKYASSTSIQFDINKTDEKQALGMTTESTGQLKYQWGQLYISQNGEKKVELFYYNNVVTLVEHPDLDFDADGKNKVTVIKKNVPPLVKSLSNLFSSSKKFQKDFKVVSEKISENGKKYSASLKSKNKNIKSLEVVIDKTNLNLLEMTFVDDVDTRTTLKFENVRLNEKIKKDFFKYVVKKSDEVITE